MFRVIKNGLVGADGYTDAMSRDELVSLGGSPKPFLRWAGGKSKLVDTLIASFPNNFDGKKRNFFEPFLGGGALALALGDRHCDHYVDGHHLYINDVNPDLVLAYTAIRDDVENLMRELDKMSKKKDRAEFEAVRASSPRTDLRRASRFIYLNKTCFNGLWRVNSKGGFNVPFGKLKNPRIYDRDNLLLVSERLRGATITNTTFANAVAPARKGDLVYFDPPYIPLNATSSFAQYAKDGFGEMDQHALAGVIKGLTDKGVHVILSNSDTPLTREIFGDVLTLRQVDMARSISAQASSRGTVKEVIGVNFPVATRSALRNLRIVS